VTDTVYWCELALVGDTVCERVAVSVRDGRFVAIDTAVERPADSARLVGLTIPGMANAHSHAFHRALRGRTQVGGGSFWTWRDVMYRAAERLDPDNYHSLARATFAEMALAGVAVVGEFHYLHHQPDGGAYDDPNVMGEALLAAASEAGIRITLLDTLYLHGGLSADGYSEPAGVQRRYSDGSAENWVERVEALGPISAHKTGAVTSPAGALDPFAPSLTSEVGEVNPLGPSSAREVGEAPGSLRTQKVGAAIHSVRAVDPDSMRVVSDWASGRGAVVHAHVSEQTVENDQCVAHHGVTPTGLLERAGALGGSFSAVHSTHLTGADIAMYANANSTVCMCPTTERDLGDGIGPTALLAEAGVAMSLGTDSHAVIDMFEEARAVELDERLLSNRRGVHSAAELMSMATLNGHRTLGWDDAGSIAIGNRADLVTIALDSVRTAGTAKASALEAVVFAATATDITHVVVDGVVTVEDGRHLRIDVAQELEASINELMGP